jgi:hypothetical protein
MCFGVETRNDKHCVQIIKFGQKVGRISLEYNVTVAVEHRNSVVSHFTDAQSTNYNFNVFQKLISNFL